MGEGRWWLWLDRRTECVRAYGGRPAQAHHPAAQPQHGGFLSSDGYRASMVKDESQESGGGMGKGQGESGGLRGEVKACGSDEASRAAPPLDRKSVV